VEEDLHFLMMKIHKIVKNTIAVAAPTTTPTDTPTMIVTEVPSCDVSNKSLLVETLSLGEKEVVAFKSFGSDVVESLGILEWHFSTQLPLPEKEKRMLN